MLWRADVYRGRRARATRKACARHDPENGCHLRLPLFPALTDQHYLGIRRLRAYGRIPLPRRHRRQRARAARCVSSVRDLVEAGMMCNTFAGGGSCRRGAIAAWIAAFVAVLYWVSIST